MISKITIEHEDGQVVMVQFGPERKVGPFHVSDGKSSDTAQPSQRPQTGTEAGNTLMFIGARVGEVKNWSATNLPTSGVRNLTTGAEVPGEVVDAGRHLTDEDIDALLNDPVDGRVSLTDAGLAALEDAEKPVDALEASPASTQPEERKKKKAGAPQKCMGCKEPAVTNEWDAFLKKWMVWLGMKHRRTFNYTDIARRAGMYVQDLTHLRTNRAKMTDHRKEQLAKAFGVSVKDFLLGPVDLMGDTKSGTDSDEKPTSPPVVKRKPPEEKKDPGAIVLANGPTVAAICGACKAGEFGEKRTCGGCALLKFGPTDPDTDPDHKPVTSAAKNHICLHCVRKNRGQCDICVLTAAVEAENLITTGASLAAAVDMAVDNYTAAFERITERFDERAAAHGN